MALIPGFENDIFISYAHVDNVTLNEGQKGWIEQFYAHLKQLLDRRYGRMDMVKIWWDDKKLDGTKLFDDSIQAGIEKAAIMICIHSPGYQKSKYCLEELDLFCKKTQKDPMGIKVGDKSRIVHVLLNNIHYDEWPAPFAGTTGFPFHDASEKDDFGDPLEPRSRKFQKQMQDFRDALWNLITELQENMTGKEAVNEGEQDSGQFTIFLGEVADTLRTQRKRTIAELEKEGYRVITGIPPPDALEAHKEATEEALKKTDLAVHLLDGYPGREIVGAPEFWYPQQQVEVALASAVPQMIWLPAETELAGIEEENHRIFLDNMERGKTFDKPYEFVRGPKSKLAGEIIDLAAQLKAMQTKKQKEAGKVQVLLDTHYNDQLYALELSKTLIENQIQPFINPQEDDPRKNINLLGNRISQVRKLIFLYGKASREWVLERMSAALQLIITHNYPIDDFYIYLAPPHKDVDELVLNQKFLKINVVDSSNEKALDKEVIRQFLTDLKSS